MVVKLIDFFHSGHSKRRSKSGSLKGRKDLNFIEHGGYYEHIQGQTNELFVPEVHVYTKLDTESVVSTTRSDNTGLVAPPQPVPSVGVNEELHYTHLCDASSGQPPQSTWYKTVG